MEKFRSARKMGGEEMSKTYQQDLDDEVQELYGEYNVTLLSLSLSRWNSFPLSLFSF